VSGGLGDVGQVAADQAAATGPPDLVALDLRSLVTAVGYSGSRTIPAV
jgi:hypothetical protein